MDLSTRDACTEILELWWDRNSQGILARIPACEKFVGNEYALFRQILDEGLASVDSDRQQMEDYEKGRTATVTEVH